MPATPRHPARPLLRRAAKSGATALLAIALAAGGLAGAQKYGSATEVIDAMKAQPTPATTIATLDMTITSASGHSLSRSMQIWTADDGRSQLIKFLAPADVRGSGFLSVEKASGETETMIYLPALGRVRRVAGGQKQDAFFGSDFSYEEISSLSGDFADDFESALLETLPGPVYVLEGRAKPGSSSSYDRIVYQVPEATLVPGRVEFYRGPDLVKVLTIAETVQVGAYTLPSNIRMETVAAGSYTTLEQSDFTLDQEIPADVFTERFLQR